MAAGIINLARQHPLVLCHYRITILGDLFILEAVMFLSSGIN